MAPWPNPSPSQVFDTVWLSFTWVKWWGGAGMVVRFFIDLNWKWTWSEKSEGTFSRDFMMFRKGVEGCSLHFTYNGMYTESCQVHWSELKKWATHSGLPCLILIGGQTKFEKLWLVDGSWNFYPISHATWTDHYNESGTRIEEIAHRPQLSRLMSVQYYNSQFACQVRLMVLCFIRPSSPWRIYKLKFQPAWVS